MDSSAAKNRLVNLVSHGNLNPVHAIINRRLWNFSGPSAFSKWLGAHHAFARGKKSFRALEAMANLPPEDLKHTLRSLGLRVEISERAERDMGKKPTRGELAGWTGWRKFFGTLPAIPGDVTNSNELRAWIKKEGAVAKKFDVEASLKRAAPKEKEIAPPRDDWEAWNAHHEAEHAKNEAKRKAVDSISTYAQQMRAFGKMHRATSTLTAPTLVLLARQKGVKIEESAPQVQELPNQIKTFLKGEFRNLRRKPITTEEARALVGAYAQLHSPSFLSVFSRLMKFSSSNLRGAMGLPPFARKTARKPKEIKKQQRKKWETSDRTPKNTFQRAVANQRRILEADEETTPGRRRKIIWRKPKLESEFADAVVRAGKKVRQSIRLDGTYEEKLRTEKKRRFQKQNKRKRFEE